MRLSLVLAATLAFTAANADAPTLRFNGSECMDLGEDLGLSGALSVQADVRFDSEGQGDLYATVFEAVDSATAQNALYLGLVRGHWQLEVNDNDHWEGNSCDNGRTLCVPASLAAGRAQAVTVTVTATGTELYIDGALVGSLPVVPARLAEMRWLVGCDIDSASAAVSDGFDGEMFGFSLIPLEGASAVADPALTPDAR